MTTRWMLVVEVNNEGAHRHIDIDDPSQAAHVINEINEQSGKILRYSLYQYEREWRCDRDRCYAGRFPTFTAKAIAAGA